MPQSLIKFRPAQEEAFLCNLGMLFLIWRRQFGKSFYLAGQSLDWMMETPGVLVTLMSAVMRMARENIRKEAEVWREMMGQLRKAALAGGFDFTTTADDDKRELLDVDAIADLFEHGKLATHLWFDNATDSRTEIVAADENAVGNTGHLILDEVGRMENFREICEAAFPVAASSPQFKIRGATTIPPDDTHHSFELLVPEDPDMVFPVNPRGNFYTSAQGIPVHRCSASDAYAAGFPIYDLVTREALTPEESRRRSLDKDAWDRNFGCKWIKGGTAALGNNELLHAMMAGKDQGLAINITEEIREVLV